MLLSDVTRKGCAGLVRSEFCNATGACPGPAAPQGSQVAVVSLQASTGS
jgi:hypothetical protein